MKILPIPKLVDVNKYWFNNNPALTHFMSALSVTFPAGERFFMKSMNAYRSQLPQYLIKELNEFCIQEANHGRVHTELNQSFNVPKLVELEHRMEIGLKFAQKVLSKKQQLAVTICLEHITAVMGAQMSSREDVTSKMFGDEGEVYKYHMQEEIDHAHVAYDIYKYIGGGYLLRTSMMIPTTMILITLIASNWNEIMTDDKKFGNDGFISAIHTLFGPNGFISNMSDDYFEWFKIGYNPIHLQKRYLK